MTSTMTHKRFLFVDSSAWISSAVTTDINHQKAKSIFSLFDKRTILCISTFILNETITKLRKILGQAEAYIIYKKWEEKEKKKFLYILPVDRDIMEEAIDLMQKHPTPNTFSFTDATNIILMKQNKIPTLFTFDKDFKKLKISHLSIIP